MKHISEIIKEIGYLDNPSARRILTQKMTSFKKSPSISKAQGLEDYGITTDYDMVSTGEDMDYQHKEN